MSTSLSVYIVSFPNTINKYYIGYYSGTARDLILKEWVEENPNTIVHLFLPSDNAKHIVTRVLDQFKDQRFNAHIQDNYGGWIKSPLNPIMDTIHHHTSTSSPTQTTPDTSSGPYYLYDRSNGVMYYGIRGQTNSIVLVPDLDFYHDKWPSLRSADEITNANIHLVDGVTDLDQRYGSFIQGRGKRYANIPGSQFFL